MEDEDKLYWLRLIMGIICGLLAVVIFPESWENQGIHVGYIRLLWMLGTWLLLPFPVALVCVKIKWIGMKTKTQDDDRAKKVTGPLKPVKLALRKAGGGKFILKTGVGAFFFVFMLSSTIFFTLLYPYL
jgi:hypothetical protein